MNGNEEASRRRLYGRVALEKHLGEEADVTAEKAQDELKMESARQPGREPQRPTKPKSMR